MFYLMAAFCSGPIILYCYGDLLPSIAYILYSFCCVLLLRNRYFLPAICLLVGLVYTQATIKSQVNSQQLVFQRELPLSIDAYLCAIPVNYPYYSKATFCVMADEKGYLAGRRLSLVWPRSMDIPLDSSYYHLKVSLKSTKGTLNFIGGSYEQYLFREGVVGRGTILELVPQSHWPSYGSVFAWVERELNAYRIKVDTYLDGLLENLNHSGLSKALLLGERSDISAQDNQVLRYTGTQHLLAISGLHVGLVMFFLYRLLGPMVWKIPLVSALGLAYVMMVGASESALRAWVMVVLGLFVLSGRWKLQLSQIFISALFIVLLLDPLSPMNIGFWYSFLCVALLLLVYRLHSKLKPEGSSIILVQLVLIAGLAPVSALNGSIQGFASLWGNVIAVPWISLLVLPLSLIAFLTSLLSYDLGKALFQFNDLCINLLMEYLSSILGLFAEFVLGVEVWLLTLFVIVFLCLVVFIRVQVLRVLLASVLCLVLCVPALRTDRPSEVVVFDAGQGLALALSWADQYWLYDTGLSYGRSSLVESAVFPYFRSKERLESLSGLIVSHGDADHAGGARRVDRYLNPELLWSGEVGRVMGLKNELFCRADMSWQYEEGLIEVLYPFTEMMLEGQTSNNHSCVIRFSYRGFVFLLMGDLEGEAEMLLVEHYKDALKADVLVAGHHGSASASSFALLKHVRPEYLVVSAGFMNRFGHPHSEVVDRAQKVGARVLSTASFGALRFDLESEQLIVESARVKRAEFWQASPETAESL